MAIPTSFREYRLPKSEGYHSLTIQQASLRPLKLNEVLVKVHAVSVQFRDLLVAKGQYSLPLKPNVVPCSDLAGEVVAVGEDVKRWKAGDRVSCNFMLDWLSGELIEELVDSSLGGPIDGVLTEYKILPAHALIDIPEHLSYEEASTLPCAAITAYNALMGLSPLKGGDTVLIQGTGGVSIFGLQFAVASGATVIVTSSSNEKLEVARRLGAKHLINYRTTPDWDKEVLRITKGRGVDHVVEVGGAGTLSRSMNCTRVAGFVNIIGFVSGAGDYSDLIIKAIFRSLNFRGIDAGSRAHFEDMNRLITATNIKPVVDRVFAFEQAAEAFAYVEKQQHVGKVVIRVSKN
ncbi:Zinc-type alcohol dehydrogenase-like protein [Sparassis crispa]|uniref:Zinc-type alcohol dehydrogenase-like protein n=1 Tax=Sparassis crispa TaxID=139825 RepID=A0A401GXH5_9APHY|nr:Zinc-type alcohol dehydrogenase-like protein [Sparassis crispa]GBE86893.1 Zinc-type alcohol dehydrogenase-like protein [Sparassis crispa]